ncbi:hypothetical protein MIR68_005091 [Amoeboaphelidium protococcarum]|nr:hypothetical protein MIR68_005091 [Amoeboaphelidium protococcarum]
MRHVDEYHKFIQQQRNPFLDSDSSEDDDDEEVNQVSHVQAVKQKMEMLLAEADKQSKPCQLCLQKTQDLQNIKKQLESVTSANTVLQSQNEVTQTVFKQSQDQLSKCKAQVDTLTRKCAEQQGLISSQAQTIQDQSAKLKHVEKLIKIAEARNQKLQYEIEDSQDIIKEKDTCINTLNKANEKYVADLLRLQEQKDEEISLIREQLEKALVDLDQVQGENVSLRKQEQLLKDHVSGSLDIDFEKEIDEYKSQMDEMEQLRQEVEQLRIENRKGRRLCSIMVQELDLKQV